MVLATLATVNVRTNQSRSHSFNDASTINNKRNLSPGSLPQKWNRALFIRHLHNQKLQVVGVLHSPHDRVIAALGLKHYLP